MTNQFSASYNPTRSPVSEERYYQNMQRSRKAMTAAGPAPSTSGKEFDAWRNRATSHFNKESAYAQGAADALTKLGFFGGMKQGLKALGSGTRVPTSPTMPSEVNAGTGQSWGIGNKIKGMINQPGLLNKFKSKLNYQGRFGDPNSPLQQRNI